MTRGTGQSYRKGNNGNRPKEPRQVNYRGPGPLAAPEVLKICAWASK
jgi:hypothetical protein